jgi:hypothetical protein
MSAEANKMAPCIETREDLENELHTQNLAIIGLGNLVRAMDLKIKLLTELVDGHQEIFVRQGLAKPRPAEAGEIVH